MPVFSENTIRKMGYICDCCGEAKYLIRSCTKGCTKICINCLDNKVKKMEPRDGSGRFVKYVERQ